MANGCVQRTRDHLIQPDEPELCIALMNNDTLSYEDSRPSSDPVADSPFTLMARLEGPFSRARSVAMRHVKKAILGKTSPTALHPTSAPR